MQAKIILTTLVCFALVIALRAQSNAQDTSLVTISEDSITPGDVIRKDSTQAPSFFSGVITVTNNGISLIPNLSLGRPAALFDLSMGKGRWSFDPMLRFGLDGKPWSLIFWGHYKLYDRPKFKMSIGAHPSVVFREIPLTNSTGATRKYLIGQRYFAWEATPTYFPVKKLGFGINYLGSRGLTTDITQNTTFLSFKTYLPNISLIKKFYASIVAQFFYLKLDENDGTYASVFMGVSNTRFPISVSTFMTKKIQSNVAGKDLVWNV